jgi:hypothetical protein
VNGKQFDEEDTGFIPRSRYESKKFVKRFYVLMVREPETPLYRVGYDKAKNMPLAEHFVVVRDDRKQEAGHTVRKR